MRQSFRGLLITLLFVFLSQANAANIKGIEQELSDSVVTTKITAKFTKNKNLNPLKISVSTTNGVVKLRGHVKEKEAFVEALRLTKATKGVVSIDTRQLEIKRVNTAFTDAYITAKVEAAVLEAKVLDNESIPIVGINASTTNGIVKLSGHVCNNASITAILKRVSSIKGVKKIISQLQVQKETT